MNFSKRVVAVVTATAATLSLAGCGPRDILTGGPYRPTGHHFVKEVATPRPKYTTDTRTAESLDASKILVQCRYGPLKGCNKDQMQEYAQGAIELVWNGFYATQTSAKPPFIHLFVQHGLKQGWNTKTSCETMDRQKLPYDENLYAYCPADGTVYLGEDMMWRIYQYGTYAPILALAHEYVHRLQDLANVTSIVPIPKNWDKLSTADKLLYVTPWILLWEHQADCGAGVWLRFAQDHHMVSAKEDPIGGVVRFFDDLNKEKHRTTDPTHGMPNERRQLFLRGYNSPNGLMGCNDIHDSMGHSLASRPIVPPPTVPSTTPKALGPLKSELTLAA